jgi:hypothetical protein
VTPGPPEQHARQELEASGALNALGHRAHHADRHHAVRAEAFENVLHTEDAGQAEHDRGLQEHLVRWHVERHLEQRHNQHGRRDPGLAWKAEEHWGQQGQGGSGAQQKRLVLTPHAANRARSGGHRLRGHCEQGVVQRRANQ